MIRSGLILLILGAACALTACRSDDNGASKTTLAPANTDARPAETAVSQAASPADYRLERTRKAMRGLTYDSGLVEVDESFAVTVAERGDGAAAWSEYRRGEKLLAHNSFSAALAAFTRAVVIKPDIPDFYVGLGRALVSKRKDSQAEAAYRTGLLIAPEHIELHYLLADVLQRRAKLAGAIEQFERVIALDQENGRAHRRLAALFYYTDQPDKAWAHIEAAQNAGETVPPLLPALLNGRPPYADVRSDGRAQPGPQVRIDTNGGVYAANETSIASTDVNPLEVVASWNDWRDSYGSTEVVRMGVGVSLDGGESWTDFTVRPPTPYQSGVEGDPMTCYDNRTGDLWVGAISFSYNGGIYVARKTPGAASFEPSVMAVVSGSADKGWMAAGPAPSDPSSTNLYIAYNNGLLRSTDMGETWTGPVYIDYGLGFLPRIGPNGELYIVYWDAYDGVILKRSYNGGGSFTTHTIATRLDTWGTQETTRFPGEFRVPPMNYLAVDPNSGVLYCVYFDTTNYQSGNYNVDLYFTKSTDQGANWTTPVIINSDSFPPGDQFFPWLEVDRKGVIHMVFYNSRRHPVDDDAQHGYFDATYSTSTDGGDSWTEHYLTTTPFDSYYDGLDRYNQFMGDYLGLGVGGARVYPCYPSSQNNDTDIFTNVIVTETILGDIDGDGDVDLADLAALLAVYNLCDGDPEYLPEADLDDSGCINLSDLAELLAQYGS